jgi:hypothetical protein
MVPRDGSLHATALRWQRLTLACLLAGLVAGCGNPMTPEQKEAFVKFQSMGGRVNFRSGGYELDLTNSPVSDEDLVNLQKISNLTILKLAGTSITDAGLEHLRSIKTLKYVELPRGSVTAAGVESLKKSLPNAQVSQ